MRVLLIDADNFSAPAWIEEACAKLETTEGPFAVRRAYGSSENLKGISDSARRWSIRPFLNLSLTKNTTDVALAVDAMELACMSPRPSLIAIASGDADFLPLVVRLRERGIKVVCVSETSKMSTEAQFSYDHVLLIGDSATVGTGAEAKVVPSSKKKAAADPSAKTAAKVQAKIVTKTSTKTVAKKTKASDTKLPKAEATQSPVKSSLRDDTYERILHVLPSLKSGEWHPLGDVAKKLHEEKILGKNATTTKLFKKYPDFELLPVGKPNKVRYNA